MSIFVLSQGKFVFVIFTLITNCTRDFSQYTYVALTNKMADTWVRLRQSRVQARPVRFGQDDCTMYTHCLRCMAWIALTNNMAEIFCQLCISSRKHVKNLEQIFGEDRHLVHINLW